ncbi:MAG: hypothetical protein ACK5LC_05770 [Coprobacillaceae bacterium]
MKIYNKIRPYIISTCISFTIVSLLQPLFMSDATVGVSIDLVYHIFIVCLFVNIAIFITDFIPIESLILRMIIGATDVVAVVLLMNIFIFDMTADLTFVDLLATVLALIATYIIVFSITFFKNKSDEKSINEALKRRKKALK